MRVVGFDFGTTNSLIAVVEGDKVLPYLVDGKPTPSVVCYEGGKTIVGRDAKERLGESGLGVKGNVVRSPKVLLGKESVHVEGVERSPVDIVRDVVEHVAREAVSRGRRTDRAPVEAAVVTIPVDMEGRRRAALRDAFRQAGIRIVQFVHEPLAALYGYFRNQADMAAALRRHDRKMILVFDWGGGTLDLTLCRLDGGLLTQVRNDGASDVGGDVFDEAIRNEVVRQVRESRGLGENVQVYPDAMARLVHAAEGAKIDLSKRDRTVIYAQGFFAGAEDPDLDFSLARDALDAMIKPLVDRGMERIRRVLEAAEVTPSEISACIATGGMVNVPAIRARLHEWFGPERVHVSEETGTLIAEGAAWMAHDEARLHLAKNVELLLARNSYLTLIPAGLEMPGEGEIRSPGKFHLYCVDPRDGHAKFDLCTPDRPGEKVLPNDRRIPLATLTVGVDDKARPFRERLELDLGIDENLILHAEATSSNKADARATELHDLEFGLRLSPGSSGVGRRTRRTGTVQSHQPGSVVVRANVSHHENDSLVPGELIAEYKPRYFDTRNNPPQLQIEERLYYTPCSLCGRAANDPRCNCASRLSAY